jgi:hypothetical protein
MKSFSISIWALIIFGSLTILSCQSNQKVNIPDKTPESCHMKNISKDNPAANKEQEEKKIDEFEKLNAQIVSFLQAKDYAKALETAQYMNNKFPANPIVLYNMTCIYSLMNEKETAISFLRDAVKCGWQDWKHMDNDSDLNNIRENDAYNKIRSELMKSPPENSNE